MKSIQSILKGICETDYQQTIKKIVLDSRQVQIGDCFLAYPGATQDGRHFIEHAIAAGAAAIIYEADQAQASFLTKQNKLPHIPITSLAKKVSEIAGNYYDNPSYDLDCIAVTGTNGKSSISHYMTQMWTLLGESAAMMGTVGKGTLNQLKVSSLTTADPITIQKDLSDFREQGIQHVTLEASSHALDQGRLEALQLRSAHFTNLTHEHLDYHGTMAAYGAAKARLFSFPGLQRAIINIDARLALELQASIQVPIISYAFHSRRADFYVIEQRHHPGGLFLKIMTPEGEQSFETKLIGAFNASNLLAVLAEFYARGFPLEKLIEQAPHIYGLPGRMQSYQVPEGPLVIVDYAHTPDALENVLRSLRQHPHEKIWTVFGCGGDRDHDKRPVMGAVAEKLSDNIIICDDNPRTESPTDISKMILAGMKNPKQAMVQLQREQAIHQALGAAGPNDIVLIAGKGHEDYQIIGSDRIHFSDWEVVTQYYENVAVAEQL